MDLSDERVADSRSAICAKEFSKLIRFLGRCEENCADDVFPRYPPMALVIEHFRKRLNAFAKRDWYQDTEVALPLLHEPIIEVKVDGLGHR